MQSIRKELLLVAFLALLSSVGAGRSRQETVEFAGLIQKGITYRAEVSYDKKQGWHTSVRLRLPNHHAGRIEWVNLSEFPTLGKPGEGSRRLRIRFELVSRQVVKVQDHERWNTTYTCRILAVE